MLVVDLQDFSAEVAEVVVGCVEYVERGVLSLRGQIYQVGFELWWTLGVREVRLFSVLQRCG